MRQPMRFCFFFISQIFMTTGRIDRTLRVIMVCCSVTALFVETRLIKSFNIVRIYDI